MNNSKMRDFENEVNNETQKKQLYNIKQFNFL